ncbi:hypothetical protein C0J52_21697 [Blattella germanica]|nr:hypothetical protein C0J52_21697 [Blattella germanica]
MCAYGGLKIPIVSWSMFETTKGDVICAILKKKVYGSFFFVETSINGIVYLDMLETWLILQLNEDSNDYVFQQDACPCYYDNDVLAFLNKHLPHRWIGRTE